MTLHASDRYSSKELSETTWPDFERLFRKQGFVGDGWWCWCTFHHVASFSLPENRQLPIRAERAKRNKEKKKNLVMAGCAHGILVYAKGEPVGWCQYGPREELPRTDNTLKYRKLALENDSERTWRITCFVVDSRYRRRGVASFGLEAALEAIKKKGGGIVEAYPVSKTDQGANYIYCGTVSMFEKAGFKTVAPLAQGRTSTVVMRKTISRAS
jgi:ribosomal protein S18 acetylase RimI-like enzyme